MTTCLYSALPDYPLPKKKKNIAPEHRGKKKHSKYTYPLSVFNKNSTLISSSPPGRGALLGWSHSPTKVHPFLTQAQPNPAKALSFLPQAQTNTILIVNPSFNPLYSRSLDFPNIFTCAKSSQTNLHSGPAPTCTPLHRSEV